MIKNYKKILSIFIGMFIVLIGIQAFFLYKTYKIEEKQSYNYVNKKMESLSEPMRGSFGIREDSVQSYYLKFRRKQITEKEFTAEIDRLKKTSTPRYSKLVDSIFADDNFKVAVRYDLDNTVYTIDKEYLFKKPITLFETEKKVDKPGLTERGDWETASSVIDTDVDGGKPIKEIFRTKTSRYYEIKNINAIIFRQLWIPILCCVLILAAVLWIFVLTIKNLIKQQRQVELLHTIVDNISHEFQTPIATLKIATKSLRKDWNAENLPLIERQVTRLENLMQQLNNPESQGNFEKQTSVDDFQHFVEDLQFAYPKTDFKFENNIQSSVNFKLLDMETVIKNLAGNSAKYGASKVEITVLQNQNMLDISVKDNGWGIAKKEQKNIFEKFYRIQSDNVHNTKGLGLGLYLVNKLVEKYKGKINVESDLGKGTNIKISLPYEA